MPQIKAAANLVVLAIIAVLASGCVSTKIEWDAQRSSAIKHALSSQKPTAKYWVKEPNKPVNTILAQLIVNKSQAKQAEGIAKFLGDMKLSNGLANIIAENTKFGQATSSLKQDLNVVISYGLSNDLQVAGVHAAVSFSRYANKGQITKCYDEFEVISSTGVSESPEAFLGRDMRLINNFSDLSKLYKSLAADVAYIVNQFYFNWENINYSNAGSPVDVITFDNRLHSGAVSVQLDSKVIAYKESNFQDSLCNSVHVYSFDQSDSTSLEQYANREKNERRKEASKQKFQYQQQERNRQLMYKRMRERILNK